MGSGGVQYYFRMCVGMVTTIAGRRWHHVFTTCSGVKGGWTSMERWSSTIWTSAPVNSPLSRYPLPSPPPLAPIVKTSFPLFRLAIGAPRSTLSTVMCTTAMGSKFVTCLAPGMRPSSAGKTLTPPNASGELVRLMVMILSEPTIVMCARKISVFTYMYWHSRFFALYHCLSFLPCSLHAWGLWAVLQLWAVCHRTQWTGGRSERQTAPDWLQVQTWSEVKR